MPDPNNYILNVPQPDFAGAFSLGQESAQKAREAQAKALAQQQMDMDLAQMSQSPTVTNINQVMAKYPMLGEKFKPLLESVTAQQKQAKIGQASDIYMSLLHGKRDIAMSLLQQQADAARNSGDERGAKSAEVMKQLVESTETGDAGDKQVLTSAGMFLSAAMGPEKFAETYGKLGGEIRENAKTPAELTKLQAEAAKAAAAAKFAESSAAMDLQKQGWDITKIQNDIDISKQNARIALLNASIARETNDLKRQELALKVQDAQTARDDKLREKASEVASAQSTIDNMLSTAQMALDTPKIVLYRATGPLASKLPTTDADTANFEELVKTLGSQAFLAQVKSMRGMGSLSDAEGKKLEAGFQNLSLRQSGDRLMSNIKEMQRLLIKGRTNLTEKYGAPGTPSDMRPGVEQKTVTVEY